MPPSVKLTEPLGDAVPELARTVAAITVFPAGLMPAGVAVTLVLVAVAGTVTVTLAVPTEPPNPPLPPYTADKLLLPAASWLPFTATEAVAVPPDPERSAVPSATLPSMNATDPAGVVVPLPALTVAVSVVVPVEAMLPGLAVSVVVVGPPVGAVTVTVAEPSEEPNPLLPPYDAPMLLPPLESWLPFTVMLAVEVPPEPVSVPVPRVDPPALKVTEPPGDNVPLAALTVAVTAVGAVVAKLVGLALTVVVVLVTEVAFHPVISL